MKQFVKSLSKNSLLLWWLTIFNHLALMIYIYYRTPLDFSTDFSLQMVLLLIIALIVFSYICNIVTFRYSELKLWLLLMMFLISWHPSLIKELRAPCCTFLIFFIRSTLFYWCIVLCLLSFWERK